MFELADLTDAELTDLIDLPIDWAEQPADVGPWIAARLPQGWGELVRLAALRWPTEILTQERLAELGPAVAADPSLLPQLRGTHEGDNLLALQAVTTGLFASLPAAITPQLLDALVMHCLDAVLATQGLSVEMRTAGVRAALEHVAAAPRSQRAAELGDALMQLVRREGSLPPATLQRVADLVIADARQELPRHIHEAFWTSADLTPDLVRAVWPNVVGHHRTERLLPLMLQHPAVPLDVFRDVLLTDGALPSAEVLRVMARRPLVRAEARMRERLATAEDALVTRCLLQDDEPEAWAARFAHLTDLHPEVAMEMLEQEELPPHAPPREELVKLLMKHRLRGVRLEAIAAVGRWHDATSGKRLDGAAGQGPPPPAPARTR